MPHQGNSRRAIAAMWSIGIVTVVVAATAHAAVTRAEFNELMHAYGFYLGQSRSLEVVEKRYPELAPAVQIARLEFDGEFGASVEAIEQRLREATGEHWGEAERQMRRQLKEALQPGFRRLTQSTAEQFVAEVRERARGEMDPKALRVFLAHVPGYAENPVREMADGYTQTYRTDGSGKSLGLEMQLEVPRSWTGKPGKRPHIVRKFVSARGGGDGIILLQVHDLGVPSETRWTRDDVEQLIAQEAMVPPGAELISAEPITLETLPGVKLHYRMTGERLGAEAHVDAVSYMILYRDRGIMLQGMVGKGEANGQQWGGRRAFEDLAPLFEMVANSFVLSSMYE